MQLDEHFQRRLNEARMFFAEGKALAAEKIYRDLLKPDLPAGGRVLDSGRPRALSAHSRTAGRGRNVLPRITALS